MVKAAVFELAIAGSSPVTPSKFLRNIYELVNIVSSNANISKSIYSYICRFCLPSLVNNSRNPVRSSRYPRIPS